MDPSSFMISQITPPCRSPASRARSTAASVWPARTKYAAFASSQREDVARTRQVGWACWQDRWRLDGAGAIGRRDSGGDALGCFNGFAKRGAEARCVARRHGRQLQRVADFRAERKADQAAGVPRHEVDDLGRDFLGGDGEIAFVFAIFVVDDDQHPAGPKVLDGFGDGSKRHVVNTRIAMGGSRERRGRLEAQLLIQIRGDARETSRDCVNTLRMP